MPLLPPPVPRTALVFEELYMWHTPLAVESPYLEPGEHWENSSTKRRFYNLLSRCRYLTHLLHLPARPATKQEITRFHTETYHDRVAELSAGQGGFVGHEASLSAGGYEIACLSAGGVLAAVEALLAGRIANAYCLVRPPGHHAEADTGMGFCIFNNIVLGALHARAITATSTQPIQRIAIVDFDVHHGNGTQAAFYEDKDCLVISLHQDGNYPLNSGKIDEMGAGDALGTNINIPLPPGSGVAAYDYAFQRVVIPALDRFQPQLILVSAGFDGSFADPLARMMLTSASYRQFTQQLKLVAERHCQGRLLMAHEGGYSALYVPFCGLAVLEGLTGISAHVEDFYLEEISAWGYQGLQPYQEALINHIARVNNLAPLLSPELTMHSQMTLEVIQRFLETVDASEKDRVLALLNK